MRKTYYIIYPDYSGNLIYEPDKDIYELTYSAYTTSIALANVYVNYLKFYLKDIVPDVKVISISANRSELSQEHDEIMEILDTVSSNEHIMIDSDAYLKVVNVIDANPYNRSIDMVVSNTFYDMMMRTIIANKSSTVVNFIKIINKLSKIMEAQYIELPLLTQVIAQLQKFYVPRLILGFSASNGKKIPEYTKDMFMLNNIKDCSNLLNFTSIFYHKYYRRSKNEIE